MSRYTIPFPTHEAVVGWDDPLETFFYRVYDENEEVISSCGDWLREFNDYDAFEKVAARHGVVIPADIAEKLRDDKANTKELTPLQQQIREMFSDIFV